MKTLIIIALVYFLVKRNKPHIPIIRGTAKTVSSIAIGLVKLYNNIVYFWTSVFMEVSASLATDEESKAIREDYASWLIWTKSKTKTLSELKDAFPNDDISYCDKNGCQSVIERFGRDRMPVVNIRLGNRSWTNYNNPSEAQEGIHAMTIATIMLVACVFFVTLVVA